MKPKLSSIGGPGVLSQITIDGKTIESLRMPNKQTLYFAIIDDVFALGTLDGVKKLKRVRVSKEKLRETVRFYNRLRFSGTSPKRDDIRELDRMAASILSGDIVPTVSEEDQGGSGSGDERR
jgi:hypothetical protein